MNLDLFADTSQASPIEYQAAFNGWLRDAERAGGLSRESSTEVYQHMWAALTAWSVGNGLRLADLTAGDLADYLASRGGSDELSDRYAWRLTRLVERVLGHHCRSHDLPPNTAAAELFESRPAIRFANASDADPLPEFLAASTAKVLVTYLSAVRPGRAAAGQHWQEVRNRASVGLLLGAGITPGEVRALELMDVIVAGGRSKDLPWKLQVDGNGNSPARETPLAPWAGQLLRYWLSVRAEQGIPGCMLFPATRSTGKPWGKVAQWNSTKEVLRDAGLEDGDGGSFKLRHTFALRQLRRGKSPGEVASWLGVRPVVMAKYQRVLMAPVDVV